MRFGAFFAALTLVGLSATTAEAQMNFMPEVRAGVFARDIGTPWAGGAALGNVPIADANVELLFDTGLSDWTLWGELRPHLGATVSFSGAGPIGYAGLSWTVQVPVAPLFVEASAGAAVLGSKENVFSLGPEPGCAVRFRASASIGWQLTPSTSLMLTGEHAPPSPFCYGSGAASQAGLTNVGVRLGLRF